MANQETVRIVPGAGTAVLFMHGIAGTPDHFRAILPLEQLVPEDWSVYNVLMDGHGGEVEDFSRSSMKKWKAQVMRIFDDLCDTHERVVLVGHSMGTLFAIQMAHRRPDKVPFGFLINVPLYVGVKLHGAVNLLRLSYGLLDLNDPVQASIAHVSSINQTWQSWRYIGWLPRIYELVKEMHDTQSLVPQLKVRCIAYQSRNDEMVSCRSCKILRGAVDLRGLPRSTHFYYDPQEISMVQRQFLKEVKTSG